RWPDTFDCEVPTAATRSTTRRSPSSSSVRIASRVGSPNPRNICAATSRSRRALASCIGMRRCYRRWAMTLLALLLYVGFAGVAFGWRTWLQWRRTGDTGLRLHAAPGTVQWWAKLGFVVAVAAGLAAPLAGLVGLAPVAVLDHGPVRVAGLVVALAGGAGADGGAAPGRRRRRRAHGARDRRHVRPRPQPDLLGDARHRGRPHAHGRQRRVARRAGRTRRCARGAGPPGRGALPADRAR